MARQRCTSDVLDGLCSALKGIKMDLNSVTKLGIGFEAGSLYLADSAQTCECSGFLVKVNIFDRAPVWHDKDKVSSNVCLRKILTGPNAEPYARRMYWRDIGHCKELPRLGLHTAIRCVQRKNWGIRGDCDQLCYFCIHESELIPEYFKELGETQRE